MHFRRWLLLLGLGALALIVTVGIAAWLTARSEWAARKVAAEIAEIAGTPVSVGGVSVGVTGSTLHELHFLEEGASEDTPPWAVVPEVTADLSLSQLVRGELGNGTVTLHHPAVALRLDRDDNLLTKLPSLEGAGRAWPTFRLDNAEITLHREGRPDTIFRGINAEVRKTGDRITMTGNVDDPEWGKWMLDGGRDGANALYAIHLYTDRMRATMDKMRRLPFVPPETWEQVQLEGDTAVDLSLQFGGTGTGPAMHYRLEAVPRNMNVHVAAIDFQLQQVSGKLRVADNVITLTAIRGRAAGGEVKVDATAHLHGAGADFKFDVAADGLALQQLPASWGLPRLDGHMSGQADMQVELHDGQILTHGQGQGTIEGFLGKTLKVNLVATERGYRFDVTDTPALARQLAVALVALQPPAVPAGQRPQNVEVNFALHDVDIGELIGKLGVALPVRLQGRLTFQVKAAVPLHDVKDFKAYRFDGTIHLPWVRVEGVELSDVDARVIYEQGVARLEALSAQVPGGQPNGPAGTIHGTARIGVVPAGDLSADLTVTALPIAQLLAAIPNVQLTGGGAADGAVQFRAPTAALRDVQRWEAKARLAAKRLSVAGHAAEELAVEGRLRNGTLSLTEATGRMNGTAIRGTGQLQLTGTYPYSARIELPTVDLTAMHELFPELKPVQLAGTASVTADTRGTLNPPIVEADGAARVEGMVVNDMHVESVHTRWNANADRLRLSDINAKLYDGELTGGATVQFRPTLNGSAVLNISKLSAGDLMKDVPQSPVRLEGVVQGSVAVNMQSPSGRLEVTSEVDVQAERLRVQNIPAERVKAAVVYRDGTLEYRVTGELAGGQFDITSPHPPPDQGPPANPPGAQGRVSLRNVDLSRVASVLGMDSARPLGGRLSLETTFQYPGPGSDATGTGRLTFEDVTWGGQQIFDRLGGDIRVGDGVVNIPEFAGRIGDGSVRLRLTYDYRLPERSVAILTAQRVEAARLLAPFTAKPPLEGPLDAHLVTRLGREWTGSGQVVLPYGKVSGVSVRDARFPLGWSIAPGRRGEVRLQDASAQSSRGRLTGRAEFAWGDTARLDGQAQFSAVDLGELLSHYTDTRVVGGLANGRVDFTGRDMRSAVDLGARVQATLSQSTPSQVPVLQQIMPFILPGVGTNVQFQTGEFRGALSGGVFRIERLTLAGNLARLYAEGTVTLQKRLNLNVVANTNQLGLDPSILQILNLSLPTVGPIPLGLLNQAVSYLSNRTVSLRVTGTVQAPSIHVNPVPFLTETAVRYFLNQTGLPIPTSIQPLGTIGG